MGIVAIAAFHCAFENLMVEGHIKCGLHLTMTTRAKLRLSDFQHVERCEARFFCICGSHARNGARHILIGCGQVWRMTVTTADIVTPVFAAPEVVVLFFTGVAAKTRFGNLFGRFVLEGDNLGRIAFFGMGLAGSMTGFAASNFSFPTAYPFKLSVGSMREGFELIFMASLAGFTTDVV
jgi:hypothetical protein